jgi:Glycosyltransferases, probably involved in cell wall biogenesis
MKVLFASVIYDGVKSYIRDFIKSLQEQTYEEFHILIGNDGFSDDDYLKNIRKIKNCTIIDFSSSNLNPSEIRFELIKFASKEKYDLLVFGDSDDIFSQNRIEMVVKEYREDIAFYYNELETMGQNIDFFKNRLPAIINEPNILDNYNFVGLSNSAINLNSLNLVEILEGKKIDLKDCIAFDWLIYGIAVKCGLKGKKVEHCKTFYRIYNGNLAGETSKLTKNKIEIGIRVKKFQYDKLRRFDGNFKYKLNDIEQLEKKIEDENYYKMYIEHMNNSKEENIFWWQNIRSL